MWFTPCVSIGMEISSIAHATVWSSLSQQQCIELVVGFSSLRLTKRHRWKLNFHSYLHSLFPTLPSYRLTLALLKLSNQLKMTTCDCDTMNIPEDQTEHLYKHIYSTQIQQLISYSEHDFQNGWSELVAKITKIILLLPVLCLIFSAAFFFFSTQS